MHLRAAYLFGSEVEGRAHAFGDIDIAAFSDEASEWDLGRRVDVCARLQEEIGDDVEIHFFPAACFDHPPRASTR